MNKLTCIIVDDEAISRETLQNYVVKYCEQVEVKALCENVEEGIAAIKEHQPDIVFLDIEMPYGDGFDLLDQVETINFDVVFITAFSNYAIRALNLSATYYILKPVDIDELVSAVDKIRENRTENNETSIQSKILLDNLKVANGQMQRIVLPQLSGFIVVQVNTILYAQADDNYSIIHLMDGKKHVVSKTLKFFDEMLKDLGFMRIHKSHLVNMGGITEYKKGKTAQVKLSNGTWLDISIQRKKDFLEQFK
ncbi:MAG: LytTR family DNA-binding domain-containing protein [Crocinitomix sp.]|nr:LytTR family DNA-binding domain-containing protein [Crocinitomix sp.]